MTSVESELKRLFATYQFIRIDSIVVRQIEGLPCPAGEDCLFAPGKPPFDPNEDQCLCNEGVYTQRAEWVNADRIYVARVDDSLVVLTVFGSFGHKWFGLDVLFGTTELNFSSDGRLRLEAPNGVARATSDDWDGGQCGSGIYNPDKLRGFVYRTLVAKGRAYFGDGYLLPKDIIQYLLALRNEVANEN